jgi:hypothetical protein
MEWYAAWVMVLAEVGGVSSARSSWCIERFGRGRYRKEGASFLGLSDTITKIEQFIPGNEVD